jgi:F0F1-type ATP synthase membrane subunit c/vacuolar-type H+-ATPase subunit K
MADNLTAESFFGGLGSGFLGIWQGVGNSFNSTAAYNNAVAQDIAANAALEDERLAAEQENSKRQLNTIVIIFVVLALLPIVALVLLKKNK